MGPLLLEDKHDKEVKKIVNLKRNCFATKDVLFEESEERKRD